ncbi:zinc-ribbon domain-containing protein [Burkholderiaceae bacterium FT117]|uniref:DUF3426 domain-containing protein n=1 Tax=Zeimonas sediminis TaxID=2944268 RepID=UPI0023430CFE|nr:DUF3426 domain-containing protein [Zeimonas sediminis]MCM5570692.1 zinc-ribbon domain-containing protein [Zeimonas sediminis]
MTLVTTCPNCSTSFRVVADQLKLRRGLVRCGRCRNVFSGLDNLRRLEQEQASAGGAGQATAAGPPAAVAPPSPSSGSAAVRLLPDSGPAAGMRPDMPAPPTGEDFLPPEAASAESEPPPFGIAEATSRSRDDTTQRFGDTPRPFEEATQRLGETTQPFGETLPRVDETAPHIEDTETRVAGTDRRFDEAEGLADAGAEDYAPWRTDHGDGAGDHGDGADGADGHGDSAGDLEATHAAGSGLTSAQDTDTPGESPNTVSDEWLGTAPANIFRTPRARQEPDKPAGPAAPPASTLLDDDRRLAEELEAVAREIEAWEDGESAIDYFAAERQRRGFIGRNGGWKLLAAGTLVGALLLQAVLANRDWLAARFPVFEPAIAAIGAPLGLEIRLPRALDSLAIESFELQAAGRAGVFSVSALLRNDASHPVRWPSMLLTLTDPANRVLVRKAIDPADYLNAASVDAGLRPRSERPIRLALEADDIQPAGYSVVLFYR